MAKGLKLKVRKFRGLISTFAEVTEENLVGGGVNDMQRNVNLPGQAIIESFLYLSFQR